MAQVLVVDDHGALLRSVRRTLESSGHVVVTASDAGRAMELLDQVLFDVALVDYELPGPDDGLGLLSALEAHQPTCARVLMTAHRSTDILVQAVNEGKVHWVLGKPFRGQDVLAALEDALARVLGQLGRAAPGSERGILESLVRSAHFRLALQPIVDALDDTAVGFEGLMRARHPVFRSPARILEVARRHQLLTFVGAEVARRAAAWLERMPRGSMLFLNLHPDEFADRGRLCRQLEPLLPHANRVVLETTGESLARWPETFRDTVKRLQAAGFAIGLDDLGSAPNSLHILAESGARFIKTDVSVVQEIEHDPHKRRLVRLLRDIADAAGAHLVAEGVETRAQYAVLRELDVRWMQGFLFGLPAGRVGNRPIKPFPTA